MASGYFLQIQPDHALVAMLFHCDRMILNAWKDYHQAVIAQPEENYRSFCKDMFDPLGCDTSQKNPAFSEIQHNASEISGQLARILSELSKVSISIPKSSRIRLK